MASEPIMWVRAGTYQPPQASRMGPDGELITEKFPATAQPPSDHPLAGRNVRRWEMMMDNAGNVLRVVYTGGASDYQVDHPNYGAQIKRRHRLRGWLPYSACPVALVRSGALDPNALTVKVTGQDQCAPGTYSAGKPCPHMLAEEKARKDRNRRREEARAERFRGEAEKLQRAVMQQQAENSATTADAMKTLTDVIKALIGGGGRWPLERPNLTEEGFKEALEKRAAAPVEAVADDDELARMMMDADATASVADATDDTEPQAPAPAKPKKERK